MKFLLWVYQAFTLVELLVVIAIIAVLAALLLPALSGAKSRAKTAQCASQERQMGAGFAGFLNDHNGYYPYSTNWRVGYPNSSLYAWYDKLAPYFGYPTNGPNSTPALYSVKVSVYRCPANPWPWAPFSESPTTYNMNGLAFPACPRENWGTWGQTTNAFPAWWSKCVNMNDIVNPAGVMLLGEQPVAPPNWPIAGSVTAPSSGLPQNWYAITAILVTNVTNWQSGYVFINGDDFYAPSFNGNVSFFHNLGQNNLFPDGHTEWTSKAKLIAYSCDIGRYAVMETNRSAGSLFWDDNKLQNLTGGIPWWFNHFAGTSSY